MIDGGTQDRVTGECQVGYENRLIACPVAGYEAADSTDFD
jgi:hypothetical protein